MRKLLCLLLMLMLLPVAPVWAEGAALSIETPAEAIRPGKAFLLNFTTPAEGECDLVLRDMAGHFVMDVVTDLPVFAGQNQMWWNGTANGVSPAEMNEASVVSILKGMNSRAVFPGASG